MSSRKPRRPRWHPTADTLAIALHQAAKPAPADVDEVLQAVLDASKALREGVATERQWSILSGSLAVAHTIERQGVVRGLREHLASAEAALQAIYNRAKQPTGWRPTVLHYHELDAVHTFTDLHAFQARSLSRAEFLRAINTTTAQIRSDGGRVTVVRELKGAAA
jgi:hypothetical protein